MADKRIKLDRFLNLAARDFATKPFAKVSIARIAKEAGISTATAFAAYESKENVYRLSSGRQMPACLSGLPKVLATTRPPDDLALTITGRLNAETILFGFMNRESRNPAPLPPSRVARKSIDLFLTATGRRIADSWLTRHGAAASGPA